MASRIIYQYSSIARPLDIAYPTNRAVVMLLPLAFLIGAAKGWIYGGDLVQVLMSGARFILICFGAWALARELHPDDNPAAFLAMAFAALVGWFVPEPGLLTLFATLGLVRMVNRTTGLASRKTDSIKIVVWKKNGIYTNITKIDARKGHRTVTRYDATGKLVERKPIKPKK